MNTSIQPIQESDLPTIGKQIKTAKGSLSINRLLWKNWPDEELQYEQSLASVTKSFNDPSSTLLKIVDNDNGEILGFLVFARKQAVPPKPESEPSSMKPEDVPDRFNPDVLIAVMNASNVISKEIESIEGIELIAFAIQPRYQRKGLGSQLLKVACEGARKANLPVVAQSEPLSHGFLQKIGFQETVHVDFDLSSWAAPMSGYGPFRLTGMIWHP